MYVGFPGQFSRVFTGWVSSHIHNLYIYAIDGHTFVSGMKLKEYAYIYIYIYIYIHTISEQTAEIITLFHTRRKMHDYL